MIRDADIERHLARLEELGVSAAEARADYEFASDMVKTVYAAEYLKNDYQRTADKEAAALASAPYIAALNEKKRAFVVAEKLRHERAWRERVIDAWQTFSANARGKI